MRWTQAQKDEQGYESPAERDAMIANAPHNRYEMEARAKKVARLLTAIDRIILGIADNVTDGAWIKLADLAGEKHPPSEKTIAEIKAALRRRAGVVDHVATLEARLEDEDLDPFVRGDIEEDLCHVLVAEDA